MLEITVPGVTLWDEVNEEFIETKDQTLKLEHSLVSLSKWESKWCKPFLSKKGKTTEETIDYIKCMTIGQNINPQVYSCLTPENIKQINDYIEAPMTATTFAKNGRSTSREQITSELIYYWMIALNIPFECQKWHLNKLITLIEVCNIKNSPPKKMGKQSLMRRNAALNAARRNKLHSKG